jgi:hypothetical protein
VDHVLLYGPPGLGKTTLAGIIANEMGTNLVTTAGPAIERGGDLMGILTNLGENDVLFIDEIHRLPRNVEELLYPAMEDFAVNFVIEKGMHARASGSGSSTTWTSTPSRSSCGSSRVPRRFSRPASTPAARARSRVVPAGRRAS